jgi:hypothetical protein
MVRSRLQLIGQPLGLCEDVGVLHGDRGRRGEDLAQFGGPFVECVLAVGVDVHGADHAIGRDQWQRHHAVYAEPGDPATEARPARISAD